MTETTGRIERKVALTAVDKHMTAGELRRFVEALNEARVPDAVPVQVQTKGLGRLHKIEV